MLRYKTKTRPGLVALYDIRPGIGAGLFLQPRSPHSPFLLKCSITPCTQAQFSGGGASILMCPLLHIWRILSFRLPDRLPLTIEPSIHWQPTKIITF